MSDVEVDISGDRTSGASRALNHYDLAALMSLIADYHRHWAMSSTFFDIKVGRVLVGRGSVLFSGFGANGSISVA